MKKVNALKILLVSICLSYYIGIKAQEVPITIIHVETAGTLPTRISADDKYDITHLTLTGNLNGTDIAFIRAMAGSDSGGRETAGLLSVLDISGASIVSGGDYYLDYTNVISGKYYYTQKDSIGIQMFSNTKLISIALPNSVKIIDRDAFYKCNIANISIPDGVKTIGEEAFGSCKKLTNIALPEGLTTIEETIFSGCENLASVTIPESVKTIKKQAFYGCEKLISVTIPIGVTIIETQVFADCRSLENLVIPNTVTTIRPQAFYACNALESIILPLSLKDIEKEAFEGCEALKEIYSKNSEPPYAPTNAFSDINKETCKIYVPKGSLKAYQKALGWKDFTNIIEENPTSIDKIKNDNALIQVTSNGISVTTKELIPVSIYNVSGQKVCELKINGSEIISLNKGIYILKIKNESTKIIVP